MAFLHRHIDETTSVLDLLRREPFGTPAERVALTADFQTAGRGSRTLEGVQNTWESERGKNLLLAARFPTPAVPAAELFRVSEALSLACLQAVRDALPEPEAATCRIKWPNDLYYADGKLGGMLLEHTWCGAHAETTYFGLGLNVNQRAFCSAAPNPVSLSLIAGHDFSVSALLHALLRHLDAALDALPAQADALHAAYHAVLYRRDALHAYCDAAGRHFPAGTRFEAEILGAEPSGTLLLRTREAQCLAYGFKEIAFLAP